MRLMPDGFTKPKQTIRDVSGLIAAGLAPEATRPALDQVAARYAIALPAALRALITGPDDPITATRTGRC